jgi:hypothetical protein
MAQARASQLMTILDVVSNLAENWRCDSTGTEDATMGHQRMPQWDVQVVSDDNNNHVSLCGGQSIFAHSYNLHDGYMLVYSYDSGSDLSIMIFDLTTCRKNYIKCTPIEKLRKAKDVPRSCRRHRHRAMARRVHERGRESAVCIGFWRTRPPRHDVGWVGLVTLDWLIATYCDWSLDL